VQSGKVNMGDQLTMISATFGDEMWSARNAGLGMIMYAIKVRGSDNFVDWPTHCLARTNPNQFNRDEPANQRAII